MIGLCLPSSFVVVVMPLTTSMEYECQMILIQSFDLVRCAYIRTGTTFTCYFPLMRMYNRTLTDGGDRIPYTRTHQAENLRAEPS